MPRDLPSKMDARSLQVNDTDVMNIIIWCIFVQLCTTVWCKVELDTLSQDLCFICTSASFDTKDVIPHREHFIMRHQKQTTAVDPKIRSELAKKREFQTSWYNITRTIQQERDDTFGTQILKSKVLKFQLGREGGSKVLKFQLGRGGGSGLQTSPSPLFWGE